MATNETTDSDTRCLHIDDIQFEADSGVAERFYDHKEETRQRLGWKQLTHAEFVEILLDVQSLHLEDGEMR